MNHALHGGGKPPCWESGLAGGSHSPKRGLVASSGGSPGGKAPDQGGAGERGPAANTLMPSRHTSHTRGSPMDQKK